MVRTNTYIYNLEKLDELVKLIQELMSVCSVFTFTGVLGAGKTTLIRALLRACGVTDTIVSPTFIYMVAYTNVQEQKFYHFDLYRISLEEEFYALGFDEFIYAPDSAGSWSFIEWPEVVMPLLNRKACYITLDYWGDDQRILTYTLSPDVSDIPR